MARPSSYDIPLEEGEEELLEDEYYLAVDERGEVMQVTEEATAYQSQSGVSNMIVIPLILCIVSLVVVGLVRETIDL